MNRVVYNASYSGFCLSDKATKMLAELGVKDEEIEYYKYGNVKRHDPKLIKVVEELKKEANGKDSSLYIQKIRGNKYRIANYAGYETVEEPDHSSYIEIKPEDFYE